MTVDKEKVQRVLEGLDGEEALRRLLERELGYDYEGGLISTDDLPVGVEEEIASDPTLIASTARDGRFTVIHTRLNTPGKLSLTTERRIMERLKKSYPYSLFVFSDAGDKLWHFVNAPLDPEAQAPGHLSGRKQYRRVVVGPGERFRTATERISLLSVDDLADKSGQEPEDLAPLAVHAAHDEAFDVEAVTKEFFREYRRVFESVEESVTGLGEDEERKRYFVQRLFNRLMFVAFIEKKGWMSFQGRTDYLPALWEDYESGGREEDDFYDARLKPLFFEGFNSRDEGRGEDPVIGVVPYLNGGLFEEDADDRDESINVPDGCLDEIINGLFAGFNFTTTESTPLDVEVAVDPEMLGKVFEELVTGRHEVGAYYTPKEIVSFMCREALSGHLGDRLGASAEDDKEAVRAFIEEHDPAGLHDPEAALGALREVRVCDPACGSGAYLLGMMRELLDLRESLFATVNIDPRTTYQRKLEIIQNNLYGVDIDPFAVNIARLRLWLSLVVDYEGVNPPPLPNLDFKIEAGDSVTGPDPSGGLQLDFFRQGQISELLELKDQYLRSHQEEKHDLRQRIEDLRSEITEHIHPGEEAGGFDWQVEFAEVFAEEPAGFDVIVANPPYVRMELFKEIKPVLRKTLPEVHSDRADLYVYFYGRALQLLKRGGMLAFISSNKWLRAKYGAKLREQVAKSCRVTTLTDFGELPVFQTASTFPMVITAQKDSSTEPTTIFTQVKALDPPYPNVPMLVREFGNELPTDALEGSDWRLTDEFTAAKLRKMRARSVPLSEYTRGQIYYGVKTGFNQAFVIDGSARADLIARDPASTDVIKPFLVGKNIRKWNADTKDKWLLYMHHGIDASKLHAVIEHLKPYRIKLEQRATKQEWYELQQPQQRYTVAFNKPKIVFPDIAKEPRFAFEESGSYMGDTTFLIPEYDLYLLGVLNSSAIWEYLQQTAAVLGDADKGGRLRLKRQYVEQLPIPHSPTVDRDAISSLVRRCLDVGGVGCEEWEKEIDERVAFLYGLDDSGSNEGVALP